jgi:hypothetical protein
MFLFLLTFFGLTPEYRPILFKQIHEIVFHGNGGYDWDTVYNMPLWLRRTTFNLIKEHYDKQNEDAEKQQNMLNNTNKKSISRPNIAPPTYTAKVPRK